MFQDAVIREPADAAARARRPDGRHPRRLPHPHQGGRRRRRPRQAEPAAGQLG